MFRFFRRSGVVLLVVLTLKIMTFSLGAWECCDGSACNRFYIGAFGGGIYSNSSHTAQYGDAFFSEFTSIGPLPIIGKGDLNSASTGFGGVQIGYEWAIPTCPCWSIAPAAELEAFFFGQSRHGDLINESLVSALEEHDFHDSFQMDSSVILANLVLSFQNTCLWGFTPYIAGGIGTVRISLSDANSLQVSPPEAGVNHFNSDTSSSAWTFAAQVKAGLGYRLSSRFNIFGEYRYLYVDNSSYVFGPTNYVEHVPTTPWNVKLNNIQYNAFAFGIRYYFG